MRGRYDHFTETSKSISPSILMKKEVKHVAVERSETSASSETDQSISIRSKIKRMGPICCPRKKAIHPHQLSRQEEDQDVHNFDKHLGNYYGKERSTSVADDHDCMWLTSDCMSPSSFFQEHESLSPSFHLLTLAESDDVSGNNSSKAKPDEDNKTTSALMDRTSLMVLSLLNLDDEENGCQWISNTNAEVDLECLSLGLGSCFPCPSCKSFSDSINSKDEMEEYLMNGDDDDDEHDEEPLFWPFDRKIDWKSEETWKYFTMSPRKDMTKQLTIESGRKGYNNSGSGSSSSMSSNSGRGRVVNIKGPSRLMRESSSAKYSANVDINTNQVVHTKSESRSREIWVDDFALNEQVSIETVVGLGEFDGHEGIDSEFSEGVFLLDELPQ